MWPSARRLLFLLLLVLPVHCAASRAAAGDGDPFAPGPFRVNRFDVGTTAHPNASLAPYHLSVHFPQNNSAVAATDAAAPVLLLVTGFAGEYPVAKYAGLLDAIAAHNVVVVGADRKFVLRSKVNYTEYAEDLDGVLDYLSGGLHDDLRLRSPDTRVLPASSPILAGGHSAGNHLMVRRLVSFGCGHIGGVVMLDPVDGEDPFGFVKQFVIHPPAKVNFVVPALHIRCGLDPTGLVPCAPANMSNARFYNAWRGPIWEMNATAFGHMDLAGGLLACPGNGNATAREAYIQTIAAGVAAFAHGLSSSAMGSGASDLISGQSQFDAPVHVLYRHDLKGMSVDAIAPTCKHD